MTEPDELERRRETRHPERLPLRVQGTDVRGHFFVEVVLTENVSYSGACITINREVAVGDRLHVFISNGILQNQISGSTCWVSNENGRWRVGLKFERPPKA